MTGKAVAANGGVTDRVSFESVSHPNRPFRLNQIDPFQAI
jgi:hypothetical protein